MYAVSKKWQKLNYDLNESCGSNFHSGRNSIFVIFCSQRIFMYTRSVGVTVAKSAFLLPPPPIGGRVKQWQRWHTVLALIDRCIQMIQTLEPNDVQKPLPDISKNF